MIIRRITIENYLCYYDSKTFELSDGLNIILGENGEGKTKFFEAIEWLFNVEDKNLELLVSAKKLDETEIGESFKVSVSMTVEQYAQIKVLTKSFIATKENLNKCFTSKYSLVGTEENSTGEREQVDGSHLLNKIFPYQIRKYSMFKGEAELNIFENDSALVNLINLFSDAKHYDKYSSIGVFFKDKAEKAVDDSTKRDKQKLAAYTKLEGEITSLIRDISDIKKILVVIDEEIERIDKNLRHVENHINNAEALEILNKRIRKIDEKIVSIKASIYENYTTSLFDENWLLVHFEPTHKEFADKIASLSKKRRELQSEFDKQKGIREGEKKAKAEIINNAIPLPIGVPSKAHMEEMLNDELCKVCNREAKRGTEAYEFMIKRLEEYLESQNIVVDEEFEEILFKSDYTNRLNHMSINHEDGLKTLRSIRSNIKDLFEFNKERMNEIEDLNEQLEKERSERDQILGNSSISGEKLTDVLKNYNSWQADLKTKNQERLLQENNLKLNEASLKNKHLEKDAIDTQSANAFLIKTRNILRDVETIFNDTKEIKFDEFIKKLQEKSNNYFKDVNVDAFTGTIVFAKKIKSSQIKVDVELQEDGRKFYKPNQSLLTSMHISILFAISELASEIKEESFPMIFDAPTSSFGENKTSEFLNLIYKTENQKILLIKDFLIKDRETKLLSVKEEFNNVQRNKAFWVRLNRPFDQNNLKSINTEVITI